MRIETPAIVCAVLRHGEHGAVVRALTPAHGLLAGYVRGGRSRALRPVLLPSNLIVAEYRARTEDHLAALTVELVRSRAPLMAEPLPAMALEWTTALAAAALPEGQPYPRIYEALAGVLDAIEGAPSARGWATALAGYEALLLAELGFGVDGRVALDAGSDWSAVLAVLRANRVRLDDHLFTDRRTDVMASRGRLIARLARAVA